MDNTNLVLSGLTLFGTIILIPSLGWWLKRLIQTKDSLTTKNLELWQEGAKERHAALVEQINDLDTCMSSIKTAVQRKVELTDCLRLSAEKWERINKHSHNQKGNVVIPR